MGALARLPRAEQWADRICTQLSKSVEAIIEVGRLLTKAKAELGHGEWGRLFADDLVPFRQGTADRLMAIAKHPILSNSAHAPNLPPSWMTLYELTKADQTKLKTALKDGVITPDMQRREVKALLPPARRRNRTRPGKPRAAAHSVNYRTPGGTLYFEIARLLSDHFDALSVEDQQDLLTMLEQTLIELRTTLSSKAVEA